MFGDHFYHQRIRKAVAVFGSLFNNINIVRIDSQGNQLSAQKVPLSYAPKRDFLARIDAMENGETTERQIALKLPRLSFEILAMTYEATRQMPKTNSCIKYPADFGSTGDKIYSPVPYNISFQLSAYAKSQDDALQIVEQILPYFTPHYTVSVKPLDDYDISEDTPITLTGITFADDYEGAIENRRTIVYSLDFDMKLNLYKNISTSNSIITKSCVEFLDLNNPTDMFTKVCADSAFVLDPASTLNLTLSEDSQITKTFSMVNLPSNPTALSVKTSPSHGNVTVSLGEVLTNINGIIEAKGTYTYSGDSDYNGLDTFTFGVEGDFGTYSYPVNVTITGVEDVLDDNFGTPENTPVDVLVSTNDTLQGIVTYSVAIGGEPSNGTVQVLNAATGQFRYTPNAAFTGTDSFIYRATPTIGTSEVGTVTINVS